MPQRLRATEKPYTPVYSRNETIKHLTASIDRQRWAFDNLLIDPGYERWFRDRTLVRRVHSSTTIEGNRLDEDDAARLLRGEDFEAEETQKREILNLRNALDFVDSIAEDSEVQIDEHVIMEINRRVLAGDSRVTTPGAYRLGQNLVRDPVRGGVAYTPPNAGDVPTLMRQFGLWLRQNHAQEDGPLIAGVAHLRMAEVHPFWDGNGRTARALEALVLGRYGFAFNRLLSPERQFVWELRRYFGTLNEVVGDRYEDGRDLTTWLEYFLSTLDNEARLVSDQLVDFRRLLEAFHSDVGALKLTHRQRDLLAYIYINGSIQVRQYQEIFGMSGESARRDLKVLTGLGVVKSAGQTRSRRYLLAEEEFWRVIEDQGPRQAGSRTPHGL